MDHTYKALVFASAAHAAIKHKRKYTGEDYIIHPIEVAGLVYKYSGSQDQICAAYLHDVVEDTGVPIELIGTMFGSNVERLVKGLTDISRLEDGNRSMRKKIDREHTHAQEEDVQFVKCADLISNIRSITEHDEDFAKVYLKEKILLLDGMIPRLKATIIWKDARKLAEDSLMKLNEKKSSD